MYLYHYYFVRLGFSHCVKKHPRQLTATVCALTLSVNTTLSALKDFLELFWDCGF